MAAAACLPATELHSGRDGLWLAGNYFIVDILLHVVCAYRAIWIGKETFLADLCEKAKKRVKSLITTGPESRNLSRFKTDLRSLHCLGGHFPKSQFLPL